ncbi:hypothetical protein [Myxococcus phage Mx1]|nr:hypothetical protein [Myxococcus phage Mx1]
MASRSKKKKLQRQRWDGLYRRNCWHPTRKVWFIAREPRRPLRYYQMKSGPWEKPSCYFCESERKTK